MNKKPFIVRNVTYLVLRIFLHLHFKKDLIAEECLTVFDILLGLF